MKEAERKTERKDKVSVRGEGMTRESPEVERERESKGRRENMKRVADEHGRGRERLPVR